MNPMMTAAVRAACTVKVDYYASLKVRPAIPVCGYPDCSCKILPAQVGAALRAVSSAARPVEVEKA